MDLPRVNVERNAVERPHAGEDLADIVETQNRRHIASTVLLPGRRTRGGPLSRRMRAGPEPAAPQFDARPISVRTMFTLVRVASMPVVSVSIGGILFCVIHAYIRSAVSSP
ncbi:hypothetical protein B7760_00013 [Burkholderia glumae]|nr:hypothetical protein B7760_00013 [Burkholderia glumae]